MIWSLLLIAVRHRRLRRPPDPGPELPPVLYSPQVKISAGTQKIFATSGAGRGRAGRAGRDRGAAVHRARIQVPDDECSVHICLRSIPGDPNVVCPFVRDNVKIVT